MRNRRADGTGPSTVLNDLVWIGVVLRAARSVREMPINPDIVREARNACRELRLISRARIPMGPIMEFAIASARREAEICRLEWADNDDAARTGLVRDAKHPIAREGAGGTDGTVAVTAVRPRMSRLL